MSRDQGAADADETYGTTSWKRHIPTALGVAGGLGAGLGAYKLLSRRAMSKSPALNSMRRQAEKGFHPLVDVSQVADPIDKSEPLHHKIWHAVNEWRQPRVGSDGTLNLVNRLKLRALHGPEAIAAGSLPGGKTFRIGRDGKPTTAPLRVNGVVVNRDVDAVNGGALGAHIIGGTDFEGNETTKRLVSQLGRGGKRVEADLLLKHAPDALPRTELDLSKFMPANASSLPRAELAAQLQQSMSKNFGEKFMLKPTVGLQSGGEFPMHGQDWADALSRYDKHFADPKNLEKFKTLGDVEQTWYLRNKKLYQGHTINKVLQDPKAAILQELIPNYSHEYRVHSVGGKSFAPHSRWFNKGKHGVPDKELLDFVDGVTKRLPPEMRDGHYGFDVGVGFDPATKKRLLKVIEMNPFEQRGPGNSGGGSGFLDPHVIPGAGREVYRHATGKTDPLRRAAGTTGAALGGALLAGGAGAALTPRDPNDSSDE